MIPRSGIDVGQNLRRTSFKRATCIIDNANVTGKPDGYRLAIRAARRIFARCAGASCDKYCKQQAYQARCLAHASSLSDLVV
jgi:hypothetical protein